MRELRRGGIIVRRRDARTRAAPERLRDDVVRRRRVGADAREPLRLGGVAAEELGARKQAGSRRQLRLLSHLLEGGVAAAQIRSCLLR